MKIIIYNGSNRAQNGNTDIMTEAFIAGAQAANAECENIYLAKKIIKPCACCMECLIKTPGYCKLDDETQPLVNKFAQADIAVFATPVYADGITAITKMFMERLRPVLNPQFEQDPNNETRHTSRIENPTKLVILSSCGYPEMSHFQVITHHFERFARNLNTQIIAKIYRSQAELLPQQHPETAKIVDTYLQNVARAAEEIAKNLTISEQTKEALSQPLITKRQYLMAANMSIEKMLKKAGQI
jgi:multimeric flavodoxin WrbA